MTWAVPLHHSLCLMQSTGSLTEPGASLAAKAPKMLLSLPYYRTCVRLGLAFHGGAGDSNS